MKEDFAHHMSLHCKFSKALRSSKAFSLVEVVVALGVMSFALMAIVGLLPVGLNHFRKAVDLTVQSQIAQELTSMIQRTPYSDLDTSIGSISSPKVYTYDEEGAPVSAGNVVYTATAHLISDTDLNTLLAPTWTNGGSGKALNNIKAVQITITNKAFPANSQTITTYVANAGL